MRDFVRRAWARVCWATGSLLPARIIPNSTHLYDV